MTVLEVAGKIAVAVAREYAGDDMMIASVVRGVRGVVDMHESGKLDSETALARLKSLDDTVRRDREEARRRLREMWDETDTKDGG